MYEKTTRSVTVTVRPQYHDDQSKPEEGHFVWAYHVKIENRSEHTLQLLTRYWRIVDGAGRAQEVKGPGVVGEQPILRPSESYEYSSGCPLSTPSGFMVGSYQMRTMDGDRFDVAIPAFSLDCPHVRHSVH